MPVIPRARSLSRTRLSPQGPRCFSGFFRARPPPLRAVPAKLARNNRLAAPPCRKTSGFAFASPLRRAGSRAPSAPAPGGRRLTRHSRLRKEREDDEGRSRGWPCSPRGRSARRASRARPRRGSAVFVASKMLTKRHVAFEHFGRHVLHCFFALPSIKAASMRWLAPLNSTSLPWWTILSIMADASLSSPRTVPHFENSMFVVNIMLRLS